MLKWIKKALCALVCAWKEIIVWILVMVVVCFLIFGTLTLAYSFLLEVVLAPILAGETGGASIAVAIILILVEVIIIIIILLLVSFLVSWAWERLTKRILECWEEC